MVRNGRGRRAHPPSFSGHLLLDPHSFLLSLRDELGLFVAPPVLSLPSSFSLHVSVTTARTVVEVASPWHTLILFLACLSPLLPTSHPHPFLLFPPPTPPQSAPSRNSTPRRDPRCERRPRRTTARRSRRRTRTAAARWTRTSCWRASSRAGSKWLKSTWMNRAAWPRIIKCRPFPP